MVAVLSVELGNNITLVVEQFKNRLFLSVYIY